MVISPPPHFTLPPQKTEGHRNQRTESKIFWKAFKKLRSKHFPYWRPETSVQSWVTSSFCLVTKEAAPVPAGQKFIRMFTFLSSIWAFLLGILEYQSQKGAQRASVPEPHFMFQKFGSSKDLRICPRPHGTSESKPEPAPSSSGWQSLSA